MVKSKQGNGKSDDNLLMYIGRLLREMHCLYEQPKQRRYSRGGAFSGLVSVSWGEVGGRRFQSAHADQKILSETNPLRLVLYIYRLDKVLLKKHFKSTQQTYIQILPR